MRLFLFSFSFSLSTILSYSQDTIFTRENKQIVGKVIEIRQNEISYSVNDSSLSILSSLVAKIKYSNGTIDEFKTQDDYNLSSVNIHNQNDENILVDRGSYIMKTKVYSGTRINEFMLKTSKHDPQLLLLLEKSKKVSRHT